MFSDHSLPDISGDRLNAILVVSVNRYEVSLALTLSIKSATVPSVGQWMVQRSADPSIIVMSASTAFFVEISTWRDFFKVDFALHSHIPSSVNMAVGIGANS